MILLCEKHSRVGTVFSYYLSRKGSLLFLKRLFKKTYLSWLLLFNGEVYMLYIKFGRPEWFMFVVHEVQLLYISSHIYIVRILLLVFFSLFSSFFLLIFINCWRLNTAMFIYKWAILKCASILFQGVMAAMIK